jgi:undecaprenyl diphosphate synthase
MGSDSEAGTLERMRRVNPEADPSAWLPGVPASRIPRHIAIIMDGNGRWAAERGFPRIFGHRNGAPVVRAVMEECSRLGVEYLTLYSFSMENWRRPADEIAALMQLCVSYLDGEEAALIRKNVRLRVIGRREGLPEAVCDAIARVESRTAACTGPTLCLAINYSGRAELADAARALAERVARGEIEPSEIDEAALASRLYAPDVPDPDLMIRTAGELRISNFLLWQLSYSELWVTDVNWPDFTGEHLREAVRAYAGRSRRFGGLAATSDESTPG